jgi:5-methyltetrahydrofolate--homocysteine methyltransferase
MAISNPSQELLVCTAQATDLLLAKKDANLTYIETVSVLKEKHEKEEQEKARLAALAAAAGNLPVSGSGEPAKAAAAVESVATESGRSKAADSVYEAVLKGNRSSIAGITKDALDAGEDPQVLLNDALIPAINEVGKRFDSGKYFLPQLIGSAEAMKLSIEVLEPLLASDAAEGEKAVVVIATVEGDIHDIGKNLVAMMLKNYGFDVVDLGKDVPCDEILRTAKERKADIICLSALMTTTMQRMKDVVEAVKQEGLSVKVMVGGAVVTQEYADEIGADGYSRDASEAVKVARKLLGIAE